MPDKFTATWISHSSISDYIACPRAYYLKNVYKGPDTSHKINLMAPALALGQAVHEPFERIIKGQGKDMYILPELREEDVEEVVL